MNLLSLLWPLLWALLVQGQDYEVADISCTFGGSDFTDDNAVASLADGRLRATLRKPDGFMGVPIFADDRQLNPDSDPDCQIRPDPEDTTGLVYDLRINNLSQCGVIVQNGFVNVRIWFPKLPGVVMMSDQEVIIMCKPAESVITTNKAAGFSGKLPPAARVSGIVEETPGKLEYEVALYKETSNNIDDQTTSEVPVDQAVPIGTKLQLRASINTESAWKYVKLIEVTISPKPDDAYAKGHVTLIDNGCRVEEFYTILPRQPYRPEGNQGEVRLEFEAVLLDAQRDRANQLWIHARIKACVIASDCVPEFCLDFQQPKGAGRRRRDLRASDGRATLVSDHLIKREPNSPRNFFPVRSSAKFHTKYQRSDEEDDDDDQTKSTKFGDNVGVTVMLPGDEVYHHGDEKRVHEQLTTNKNSSSRKPSLDDCHTFLIVGGVLGSLLVISSTMMCYLSQRLFRLSRKYKKEKLDEVVREHRRKFGSAAMALPSPSGLMRLQQQRDQLRLQSQSRS